MVMALRKQIDAELAALESLGESTKDMRTGINATGCTGRRRMDRSSSSTRDAIMRERSSPSSSGINCSRVPSW
jgi:hypothetical protein